MSCRCGAIMANGLRFDRLKLLVRTMAANSKTIGNGGGFGGRWWERSFAVVLILIAVIAAILLFLVMARGYCECRTWSDWSAGMPCPEGCSTAQTPADWNQDALLYCRKQLGSYGSTDVADLPGASQWPTVHERYFVYQSPSAQEVYFFLAVQGSSYGDPGSTVTGSAVKLDVMRTQLDTPWSPIPVSCSGPRLISESTQNASGYGGSDRTWGWYCRVASPAGGFPGPGGFSGYRVFIKNISPQPLRYCYVAVCDRKYPKNDKCTDPAVALQIQTPSGRPGYPSSPYSPPYGGSSGYPGSGSGSYPGGSSYPGSSGGSSYPSSSSSYPGSGSSPGTQSSSPPPPSTGTGSGSDGH
jgi:hypothetical protein